VVTPRLSLYTIDVRSVSFHQTEARAAWGQDSLLVTGTTDAGSVLGVYSEGPPEVVHIRPEGSRSIPVDADRLLLHRRFGVLQKALVAALADEGLPGDRLRELIDTAPRELEAAAETRQVRVNGRDVPATRLTLDGVTCLVGLDESAVFCLFEHPYTGALDSLALTHA
jgi:hypothetical protein